MLVVLFASIEKVCFEIKAAVSEIAIGTFSLVFPWFLITTFTVKSKLFLLLMKMLSIERLFFEFAFN